MKVLYPGDWPRKPIYDFFADFECSCLETTIQIPAKPLYDYAKKNRESFFLMSLYAIDRATNTLPEFRQRALNDGRIVEFERLRVLTPVMGPGEQFVGVFFDYADTYPEFRALANPIIESAKRGEQEQLIFDQKIHRDYLLATCLPWFSFTGMTPCKRLQHQDEVVITWGKLTKDSQIPMSIQVNHGFIDGVHLGKFVNLLESFFAEPERLFQK